MALFQNAVIKKYLQAQNKELLKEKWLQFKLHFHNPTIQENIRNSKEEQYQGEFLIDLFVNILGYTKNPQPNFNLTTEYKNVKDSKKADGAILIDEKVRAVIELKGTNTTDLGKIETQAFGYKNNQPDCIYIITSNFEKIRFYIDNAIEFLEFNLFQLQPNEFELLYLCLAHENLSKGIAKSIKEESVSQEDVITKKLYKDYSLFKRELYHNLVALNPEYEPLELFKKSQKLLDRFLFIFFAEDRNLLPTNLIFRINKEWQNLRLMRIEVSLYDRYKIYFNDLNSGAKVVLPAFSETASKQIEEHQIFAYNGGLFKADEILDTIKIDDAVLFKHTENLSNYDFASEVDVNILGHIFENSLNELDEIKAELEGEVIDKTKTKRKKDGVFYTPKYITKYIVDNTIGKLCNEKKIELGIGNEVVNLSYVTKGKNPKLSSLGKDYNLKLKEYRNWLLNLKICDPACGSGAFLNQSLEFLISEHNLLESYVLQLQELISGKGIQTTGLRDITDEILENNLFGVDLNEESVEIAKLSLWLRTAQPNRKLNDLSGNIKCGNSLIDDPEIAGDKAFNWQQAFPQVFANGGFDVIIGNPPYVQLQSMGSVSDDLQKMKYQTFEKTSDLYCLFHELGNIILKENGLLGFITSNKWLRANYGKSLRNYLIENTQPIELIDLGSGIFESATVDSNILIFKKTKINRKPFIGLDISKEKIFIDFNIYESLKVEINPAKDDIWAISNPIESKIKAKVEVVGIPLKDWDIKINYGIKTGFNDAFIIDETTKNELIFKDSKNAEIILPILRGRDVSRYNIDYQNLYLINVHNGYNGIPEIKIEDYPTIKEHLDEFYPQLEKRGDKGKTPYNLRNCAYVNSFLDDKIIWKEMSSETPFTIDKNGFFTNDTVTFINGKNLEYLLVLLNSKLILHIYSKYYSGGGLGSNGLRFKKEFLSNLPLTRIDDSEQIPFIEKANQMLSLNKNLQEILQKFQRTLQRKFELDMLPKKLENWYELTFAEFVKELAKKKIKLSLSEEAEWEDYFLQEQQKAVAIKNEIVATDKTIDKMVYELYGLSEEEISIVENS